VRRSGSTRGDAISFGQPPEGGGGGFGPPGGAPPGGGFGPPPGGDPFGQPPAGGALPPAGGGFGPAPGAPGPGAPAIDPVAIAAAALGVVSLITCFCCGIFGVPIPLLAAGAGAFSLIRQKNEPEKFGGPSKILAIVGIAVGALSLIMMIVGLIIGFGGNVMQNF
jgi:hypothetical protein